MHRFLARYTTALAASLKRLNPLRSAAARRPVREEAPRSAAAPERAREGAAGCRGHQRRRQQSQRRRLEEGFYSGAGTLLMAAAPVLHAHKLTFYPAHLCSCQTVVLRKAILQTRQKVVQWAAGSRPVLQACHTITLTCTVHWRSMPARSTPQTSSSAKMRMERTFAWAKAILAR